MKNTAIRFYIFTLVATLFIGVCFTSADFLTIPVDGFKDLMVVVAQWAVVVGTLYLAVTAIAVNRYIFAILFPIITIFSSMLAWFRFTINATLTPMILDAALQNDIRTSADLISPGLLLLMLSAIAVSFILTYYRWHRIAIRYPQAHALIAISLLLAINSIGSLRRPISERIPFNIYYTTMRYLEERRTVAEVRRDLTDGISGGYDDIDVVFVLGESLRPDHLGLNGYKRETTPLLRREDVISFPYIYTEQTYTNRSVPHILSRADSSDFSRAYSEKSFIHMFKACGFRTAWLANQEAADTYIYFMNEADTLIYANIDKSSYVFDRWVDGDLLPLFDDIMDRRGGRTLTILHTIGSHWWYNSHFTDEFERFKPVVKSKVISSCTSEEMINSYDNTVLYTDYFLSQLIERLRERNAILIYQSDHGESLGEDGVWLHASDTEQTHSAAALIWMSPKYRMLHPEHYERARSNSERYYRTDYLFHSILDAAGIKSPYIDNGLSVFR